MSKNTCHFDGKLLLKLTQDGAKIIPSQMQLNVFLHYPDIEKGIE